MGAVKKQKKQNQQGRQKQQQVRRGTGTKKENTIKQKCRLMLLVNLKPIHSNPEIVTLMFTDALRRRDCTASLTHLIFLIFV